MAKLYSFADGILRTHITWEDLQEKAKEIWGEKAVFGANKSASSIGDGRVGLPSIDRATSRDSCPRCV